MTAVVRWRSIATQAEAATTPAYGGRVLRSHAGKGRHGSTRSEARAAGEATLTAWARNVRLAAGMVCACGGWARPREGSGQYV
jgi:hypothetical protein